MTSQKCVQKILAIDINERVDCLTEYSEPTQQAVCIEVVQTCAVIITATWFFLIYIKISQNNKYILSTHVDPCPKKLGV